MTEYLDFAGVIFLVLRPDQTVEIINKKGCSVLGYSKEEIEGENWFDKFLPPEVQAQTREVFLNLMNGCTEAPEYSETPVLTSDGNIWPVKWHTVPLLNPEGVIVGLLSSGQDILEKKVLQSRLIHQEVEKRRQLLTAVLEAQEDERQEIAYELHDNVNQILTSCKLLLEQELHSGQQSPFVLSTYKYIQNAINEIRNLSHRLSPSQLNDLGLEESILELIERTNLYARINIHFAFRPADANATLTTGLCISLLRIVQEHLNNIIKHAEASETSITLDLSGQTADLEIRDNGKGFDLKDTKRGLGINNMYNRTELHSGQAYINTSPGEGCILSICIPLPQL